MRISFSKQTAEKRRLIPQQSKLQFLSKTNHRKTVTYMQRVNHLLSRKSCFLLDSLRSAWVGEHVEFRVSWQRLHCSCGFFLFSFRYSFTWTCAVHWISPIPCSPAWGSQSWEMCSKADITRLFGGGQQPYSSPDWTREMWTSPLHFPFRSCYFRQSFPWQIAQSKTEKSQALKHHRCSLQPPLPRCLGWDAKNATGHHKNPIVDVLGSPGGGCSTSSARPLSQE